MDGGRFRTFGKASSHRLRCCIAIASFCLVALSIIGFACAGFGVFQRAFVIQVDSAIASTLGLEGTQSIAGAQAASTDEGSSDEESDTADQAGDAASNPSSSLFSQLKLPDSQTISDKIDSAKEDPDEGNADKGQSDASGEASNGGGSGSDADYDSSGDGTSDSPNGGGNDTAPADPGVPEAQEQAYLQALRTNYDTLGGYYQRAVAGWQDFLQVAPTSTENVRNQRWNTANALAYDAAVTHGNFTSLQVPENSKHYASYQTLLQLNHDIDSAAALLNQAWARCCFNFENPDDWMTPYYANSVNGKITFIADFEARYPGARP